MSSARATVDLAALADNLERLRTRAGGQKILAVVKADGYGHGAARVARALEGADGFAVARLAEALALREAGITARIVVLSGHTDGSSLPVFAAQRLEPVVHHRSQVDWLAGTRLARRLTVWVEIDTGMGRLGLAPDALEETLERLAGCGTVAPEPVLMTHLANADDRSDPSTVEQLRTFAAAVRDRPGERSIANSAGLLAWAEARSDWARPGIALYGISPFPGRDGRAHGLRPAMTLRTRLIARREARGGSRVGYGGTWKCPEDMPIGVAAIGYGDGYPRHAPSGTPVLVDGAPAAVAGRISMDLMTLDLRHCPSAAVGSEVILWGGGLPAETVARSAGTIAYELVTRIGRRVVVDAG